jgi:hypothetical protein
MHNHQTFRPMLVSCECCKLLREFTFTSKHDQVICKGCLPHSGSPEKQQRKLRDHVGLYLSELRIEQDERREEVDEYRDKLRELRLQHQDELDQLAARNAQLAEALRDRATNPDVDRWLADEAVTMAREQRDRAYRKRDYAFAAIWQIHRLHHNDDNASGFCSCNKPQGRCKELGAIEPELDELRHWEDIQIQRLRDGHYHGLPDNHPEVLRLAGRGFGRRQSRIV